MIQFYFLSIVLNITVGLNLLLQGESKDSAGLIENLRILFKNQTLCLILGILTVLVGVFKILSVVRLDVPIVGDLFPATMGILSGSSLLFEFYRDSSTSGIDTMPRITGFLSARRQWIGWAAILSAALHFLFPNVLFL